MKEKLVVMVDSGIGGLHILKYCVSLMPNVNYIYVADYANHPYGSKNKKDLKQIALYLFKTLEKEYHPDLFVVACNTLTVNTVSWLREKIKTPFVATEPALKTALKIGGDCILLATKSTLKQEKKLYKKVKSDNKKCGKIFKVYIKNLPSLIEENLFNIDKLSLLLKKQLCKKKFQKVKSIVLGCTHFVAIKRLLENMGKWQVIDSSLPVAMQVYKMLGVVESGKGRVKFLATNGNEIKKLTLRKYFNNLTIFNNK